MEEDMTWLLRFTTTPTRLVSTGIAYARKVSRSEKHSEFLTLEPSVRGGGRGDQEEEIREISDC
eukprot:293985-Hanusia_phi.AAC.1